MIYYGKYFDQNEIEIKEGMILQIGDDQELVSVHNGRLYLGQYLLSDFCRKFIGKNKMQISGFIV